MNPDENNVVGIHGQRFRYDGRKSGTEFNVDTSASQDRYNDVSPSVGVSSDGRFVVVWDAPYGQDGSYDGVFAQRYDKDGEKTGTQFVVPSYVLYSQLGSKVLANSDGSFVVSWNDSGGLLGQPARGIVAQRFNGDGKRVGTEFFLADQGANFPSGRSLKRAAGRGLLAAWREFNRDGSGLGVIARGFNADGSPATDEQVANVYTTGDQNHPDLAAFADGSAVVVWDSVAQDGSSRGIYGRFLDAVGQPVGTEFQINRYTTGDQQSPLVTSLDTGGFVVVWSSYGQDANDGKPGVFGRRYSADRVADATEFQANSYTTGYQGSDFDGVGIAALDGGRFVVTWHGLGPAQEEDTPNWAIFARLFIADGQCGDVDGDGTSDSTDALIAIRGAVGARFCATCLCDANGDGTVTATDALRVLQAAVGMSVSLQCGAC